MIINYTRLYHYQEIKLNKVVKVIMVLKRALSFWFNIGVQSQNMLT